VTKRPPIIGTGKGATAIAKWRFDPERRRLYTFDAGKDQQGPPPAFYSYDDAAAAAAAAGVPSAPVVPFFRWFTTRGLLLLVVWENQHRYRPAATAREATAAAERIARAIGTKPRKPTRNPRAKYFSAYGKKRRATMTPAQREAAREYNTEYRRQLRATMTPEQHAAYLAKRREQRRAQRARKKAAP